MSAVLESLLNILFCVYSGNPETKVGVVFCRCKGLMILETFTTLTGDELQLPSFLKISHEITGESSYSMYYLSSKDADDPAMPNHFTSKPTIAAMPNGFAVHVDG